MPDPLARRSVRLLVPDTTGAHLLVDAAGDLPCVEVELHEGDTTASALATHVLPGVGLETVVDCLIDQSDPEPGAPVAALVEVAPPAASWKAPLGWRWQPLTAAAPRAAPGLQAHLDTVLAERRAGAAPPPGRPPWACAGWHARVRAWIDECLVASGGAPATSVVPLRLWGISALQRVESPGGRCWAKASCEHFRAEAAVTAFLAREAPGVVPPVIGVDEAEGWLLLGDVGSRTVEAEPAAERDAIGALVRLQHRFVPRTASLAAAGCRVRPIERVADDLAAVLTVDAVARRIPAMAERATAVVASVARASAAVHALGLPDTLVHGDFHPGNVAVQDHGPVLLDWSDAAVGHPLVETATWAWWFTDDPHRVDEIWTTFVDGWADVVPAGRLHAARAAVDLAVAAYHLVSYAGIVASLEPTRQDEHAEGLTTFAERVLEAA